MNKAIYKYQLFLMEYQEIVIPKDAEIISAHIINEEIFVWASFIIPAGMSLGEMKRDSTQVDHRPDKFDHRIIRIVGTGYEFNEDRDWKFIATVLLSGGSFVYHIFEKK